MAYVSKPKPPDYGDDNDGDDCDGDGADVHEDDDDDGDRDNPMQGASPGSLALRARLRPQGAVITKPASASPLLSSRTILVSLNR